METPRWPDFFIVGTARAGTTTLYASLEKHPKVFIPWLKEPGYFFVPTNLLPGLSAKDYLDLFKQAEPDQIIGEATPTYLLDECAAQRIHQEDT